MKPRIHVITLAVDDLERSLAFYRNLGLGSPGIVGTEWPADDEHAAGAIATFQLHGGLILGLYPRSELARDAGVPVSAASSGAFSIGHVVETREEVDAPACRRHRRRGDGDRAAARTPLGYLQRLLP